MLDPLKTIESLKKAAFQEVLQAASVPELERARLAHLGRKAPLTQALKGLSDLSINQKKELGTALNQIKEELSALCDRRASELWDAEPAVYPALDVTLPGKTAQPAHLHPTIQMMYDLNDAFASLNFDLYEGPEISTEAYEFDCLNFPPDHPARESMDTFWLNKGGEIPGSDRFCLRPHLTGASIRYMQTHEPPFRFVYPGRVYRNETTDVRHECAFFQYEALIVDKGLSFTAGQLLINTILETVFGRPVKTRMRSGFFPFVEPGFEIDMQCLLCEGKGCRLCKQVGWLEIMPGGMPHPNVLQAAGIDPAHWTGFYINIGLDRLVMMRYGIEDVRLFHGNDLRFLHQFA